MRNKRVVVAIILLAIPALACQTLLGRGSIRLSTSLFEEDFSSRSNDWDVISDEDASLDYVADEYAIQIFTTELLVWANPNGANLSLADVHVEVTARNIGAATEPGFGIICSYVDEANTYRMGVSSDGFHIITKRVDGVETVLTDPENGQWTTSDRVPLNASSYRLGADCGNGTLTLYVDGRRVASVNDSTLTAGTVGLFAAAFAEQPVEIRFDDLVVTALP